jgi:hypothetical protein
MVYSNAKLKSVAIKHLVLDDFEYENCRTNIYLYVLYYDSLKQILITQT